jgi:hypothetical protein
MIRPYCPQRREARLARCPVCPLSVFWVYNKVAISGDVVIEKPRFSIVDTHEPVIAMPLSPFCLHIMDSYPHKNQIFLVGRHQEVRRFVSPGLHHIKSVSSHCGMSRNERHTTTSSATIFRCQPAFKAAIYWDRYLGGRRWNGVEREGEGEGGTGEWKGHLMRGTPFS